MIFTVGRRMSVVEEKKEQCKVKNSRKKRAMQSQKFKKKKSNAKSKIQE
jgi:hypothetical protein